MSSEGGFTLLELMIALSLGLLVAAAIGSIYIGSNQTYRVQEDSARIQETGRYALEVIGRSLRQAGYINIPVPPPPVITFAGTPIDGTDGAPDTITIQYDGTGQADCTGDVIAFGAMATEEFEVDDSSLRCNDQPLVGDPAGPVIEDLQVMYGIDTDADQAANQYSNASDIDTAEWDNVVTARVCVLVRSSNRGIATAGQPNISCGVALGAAANSAAVGDGFLRRYFVATFTLRNRIHDQP